MFTYFVMLLKSLIFSYTYFVMFANLFYGSMYHLLYLSFIGNLLVFRSAYYFNYILLVLYEFTDKLLLFIFLNSPLSYIFGKVNEPCML